MGTGGCTISEINLYQYAVINRPGAQPLVLGSKNKPTTITLTGTGEVYHRVFNDIAATTLTDLYVEELTDIKFFGVKCSRAATLGFGTADGAAASASAILLTADAWQFFANGQTTSSLSHLGVRTAEAAVDIAKMQIYIPGGTGDVEVIAVY